ncbi:MAG: hypothetical protein JWO38_7290 [Gemmataceae bacterium]|nr:hypothetical protein [Gemmataceae bacterium]
MATDKTKVETYFKQVVQDYNCGDVRELLRLRLDKAGPLLACTVNGIDVVGGMMLGFHEGNSRKRSTEFMRQHLSLTEESADLMYVLVRCGLAHEGVPTLAVQFFVHYERCDPKKLLYKDDKNAIWLNVTELAHCYLEAIEQIAKDVHRHLSHVPEPGSKGITIYQQALGLVTTRITDFWGKIGSTQPPPRSSLSPFFPESLKHFTVKTP